MFSAQTKQLMSRTCISSVLFQCFRFFKNKSIKTIFKQFAYYLAPPLLQSLHFEGKTVLCVALPPFPVFPTVKKTLTLTPLLFIQTRATHPPCISSTASVRTTLYFPWRTGSRRVEKCLCAVNGSWSVFSLVEANNRWAISHGATFLLINLHPLTAIRLHISDPVWLLNEIQSVSRSRRCNKGRAAAITANLPKHKLFSPLLRFSPPFYPSATHFLLVAFFFPTRQQPRCRWVHFSSLFPW